MPFERPTLAELKTQAKEEIASRLGLGALLPRSPLVALALVEAGQAHLLHGHLAFLARQILPDTAEAEYLERWASIFGVARKAATFAEGQISLTGTPAAVLPAGSKLRRADAVEYSTDAEVVIGGGGTATADVTAVAAGLAGNAEAGVPLTLSSPVAGVASLATVAAGGLISGADEETDDELRRRLLQRVQNTPEGGAAADYVRWALEVPGVTRAWCLPGHLGAGTVGVTFVVDGEADIIPDAPKVAEVQALLEERRPATAAVTAFAPDAVALDPEIQLDPDTAEIRAAVEAALIDLLRRESEPGGTLLLSHVREAISNARGEVDHVLVAPAADVTVAAGELLTLGTITWS
jgi:uncharacterized phage protein gp47/JayE